jgi:hypothetical protein
MKGASASGSGDRLGDGRESRQQTADMRHVRRMGYPYESVLPPELGAEWPPHAPRHDQRRAAHPPLTAVW